MEKTDNGIMTDETETDIVNKELINILLKKIEFMKDLGEKTTIIHLIKHYHQNDNTKELYKLLRHGNGSIDTLMVSLYDMVIDYIMKLISFDLCWTIDEKQMTLWDYAEKHGLFFLKADIYNKYCAKINEIGDVSMACTFEMMPKYNKFVKLRHELSKFYIIRY